MRKVLNIPYNHHNNAVPFGSPVDPEVKSEKFLIRVVIIICNFFFNKFKFREVKINYFFRFEFIVSTNYSTFI